MPDENMTGEFPRAQDPHAENAASTPAESIEPKNQESQGFFARFRQKDTDINPEDAISADLTRINKLRTINASMAESKFDPFGQNPLEIPEIDAESALKVFRIASSGEQKRQRKAYAQTTIGAIRQTKHIMMGDIRTLYIDQGKTPEEIGRETETLTTAVVNGKKRMFESLGKDSQVAILENISETRGAMLRANWPDYIYYLSNDQDALNLTNSDIEKLKDKYMGADEATQTKLAAETRQNALRAMDKTRKVNLDRLGELLINSGMSASDAEERLEEFRGRFRTGTLADKDKIIDEIIEAKQMLILPHLDEIIHLREVIEHQKRKLPLEVDASLDDSKRLDMEAQMIKDLLTNASYSYAMNEVTTLHLAESARDIAMEVGDPSLIDTFRLVELLETKI